MRKIIFIISISASLTVCCDDYDDTVTPASGSAAAPAVQTIDVGQELSKISTNTVVSYDLPGMIVSIADHTTNTLKDAYYNVPGSVSNLTSNSVFRVGSVTKMMVAVLLLRLQELQMINLTAPIQLVPYSYSTVNLLNHTAGLGNFLASPYVFTPQSQLVSPNYQWSFQQLMSLSAPTTPYIHTYSNTGYLMAGRIAELASGQPFNSVLTPQLQTLLSTHVFGKAGMVTALFNQNQNPITNMAIGIEGTSQGLVNVTYPNPSVYNSAGAVVASTTDLHRFLRALFNNQLINQDSRNAMMDLYLVGTGQPNIQAGLGIFIEANAFGKKYYHGGTVPGYNCIVAYYEKYNKSIVVATNTNTNGIGTKAVYDALSKAEQLLPFK